MKEEDEEGGKRGQSESEERRRIGGENEDRERLRRQSAKVRRGLWGERGTVEGRAVYENGFEAKFGGLVSLQRKLPLTHPGRGCEASAESRAGADFTALAG